MDMKVTVFDRAPHVLVYLVTLVIVVSTGLLIIDLAKHWRKWGALPARIFGLAMAAVALWFFTTSMFFRFHSVALAPDRVELRYYWPRPPETIETTSLEAVDVVRYSGRGGFMAISARGRVFRSVDFRQPTAAEKLKAAISERWNQSQR
jgi:hypothetical protein